MSCHIRGVAGRGRGVEKAPRNRLRGCSLFHVWPSTSCVRIVRRVHAHVNDIVPGRRCVHTLCIRQISPSKSGAGKCGKIRLASHATATPTVYKQQQPNSNTTTGRPAPRRPPRHARARGPAAPVPSRVRGGVDGRPARPLYPRLGIRRTPTRPAAPPAPPSGSAVRLPAGEAPLTAPPARPSADASSASAKARAALRPRERRSGLGHHLRALGRRYSEELRLDAIDDVLTRSARSVCRLRARRDAAAARDDKVERELRRAGHVREPW